MQSFSTFVLPHTPTMSMSAWHRSLTDQLSTRGTIGLTHVWQHDKLFGNKEKHGLGDSNTDHHCSRMVACEESKEGWHTVSLCCTKEPGSWQETSMALYRSSGKAGNHDRAGDTHKAQRKQLGVIPKNDIDPSTGGNLKDGP